VRNEQPVSLRTIEIAAAPLASRYTSAPFPFDMGGTQLRASVKDGKGRRIIEQ
jgi:hypothetical protein